MLFSIPATQHKNPEGYVALVTVLIVGAIGLVITTALLLWGQASAKTSLARQTSAEARALADACAEQGLQSIRDSGSFEGYVAVAFSLGNCSYTVTKLTGQNRIVTASSTVGTIVRKTKVTLDKITPSINITSWQELADF